MIRFAPWLFAVVFAAVFAAAGPRPTPAFAADNSPVTENASWRAAWLAVELNGVSAGDTVAVITSDGTLWLERILLTRWRLAGVEERPAREFLGRQYLAMKDLGSSNELRWSLDSQRQILSVDADPRAMRTTQIATATTSSASNVPRQFGAFLNYDLATTRGLATSRERSTSREDDYSLASGLLDLTLFRGPVSLQASSAGARDDAGTRFLRLDTTLEADFPSRTATLRVGDAIASGGQWGHAVRMGGVQWATNFETQPELLTFPLASIAGEAAVPSSVDVFVNGSLAASHEVPAGPFSITDLPVVSGSGVIVARVRDAFGREQLVSQRVYSSPRLLRPGLNAYAFELGKVRESFGTPSDRYGREFLQGTWRRGLTASQTGEVRAQILEDRAVAGFALAHRLADYGVLQTAMAGSCSRGDCGTLLQAGYEYAARRLSIGTLIRWSDASFRELGDVSPDDERLDVTTHVGWSTPRLGSLSVAWVRREGRRRASIATATFSRNLGPLGFAGVTFSRDLDEHRSVAFLGVTRMLGREHSTRLAASGGAQESTVSAEFRRHRYGGRGAAYRLETEQGQRQRVDAELEWQGRAGLLGTEIAHRDGETGLQVRGNGAVALLGGHWAFMPSIEDNFALVSAPGMPNLPIYQDNRIVAYTDRHGVGALSGLRAYERNRIHVNPLDVPLDLNLADTEFDVVPYGRGGAILEMRVTAGRGVLLQIVRESGEPLAAGARVEIAGRSYPVGLDGVVFLQGAMAQGSLVASDRHGTCTAVLDPSMAQPLPARTRVVCRGATMASVEP